MRGQVPEQGINIHAVLGTMLREIRRRNPDGARLSRASPL